MRCLVTGAAGFIGSHLCERLLEDGHQVIGLDTFVPSYPRALKEQNLEALHQHPEFVFCEVDLRSTDLRPLLRKVEVIFHLAGMVGVTASWSDFQLAMTCNLQATHCLLESLRSTPVERVIIASTSSVYGRESHAAEETLPAPTSPYGVTKLAAEHLCRAYSANFGVPMTILRYGGVFGPRQRPDMAYFRFIEALLNHEPVTIYGDGEQTRSNIYITDAIEVTMRALSEDAIGHVINIGGHEISSMNQVVHMLETIVGYKPQVQYMAPPPGDQRHIAADINKAVTLLQFTPRIRLAEGLAAQVEWQERLHSRMLEPASSGMVIDMV